MTLGEEPKYDSDRAAWYVAVREGPVVTRLYFHGEDAEARAWECHLGHVGGCC